MPGPKNKSENKQFSACRSSAHSCGNCDNNNKKLRDQSLLLMCTTTTKKEKKIAPKALFKRPEHILPDLIHYNQNEYVKVRSIFDAVRTIDDVLK